MNSKIRIVVIGVVVLAAVGVLMAKWFRQTGKEKEYPPKVEAERKLPRLVDLGSHSCVPCRMMAPILEELKQEYANFFLTEFVDVSQYPTVARFYRIRVIPTQIFLDADGRELFRNEGALSKEQILAIWDRLGVSVGVSKKE